MTAALALETKSAPEFDEVKAALDGLTADIAEKTAPVSDLAERLAKLEAKANRPAGEAKADNDNDPAVAETKALDHYFRKFGTSDFQPEEVKALTAGVNADGGYTIPETFIREIIKDITEFSPMRDLARITSVGGSPVILPRRLTKPTASIVAEGAASTGSQSTYGQWSVPIYEIREHTDISNQLLEDSAFDMTAEIRSDLAEAFGEKEGDLFFTGTGVDEPLGLLTDPDFVTEEASSATLDPDDLIDLFYGVKSSYSRRGAWAMNRQVIKEVRKFKNTAGDYLWQDSLADGQPATFLGKPVVEVPALGEVGASNVVAVFGDWSRGFRILDRIAMSVLPDRLTRATNGEVRFHARRRVGGKLVRPEALIGLKMPA
ncbi:phage major capsid protein [Nitratireductor rhodophyticola]|uniref:phage major capsid protein n=1 Tax=Nitratireductor rhodophyticola TaxID=2854036 RepID=UPI002AC98FC8|nr:phage major capsid protein [Nitratireductor rhodophyticola]WPZ13628.1 phage major capsid protein [Nitratireductor rhodophyticola]